MSGNFCWTVYLQINSSVLVNVCKDDSQDNASTSKSSYIGQVMFKIALVLNASCST